MFEISTLIFVTAAYLSIIFSIGTAAEKKWLPPHWGAHPLTYSLALGGYVGAWAIFGALEIAQRHGYTFIAYYFGISALFIFSPLILQPLLNLSKTYRLNSMADLFSFRYNSKAAGLLVCIGTLLSLLPLLTLQIHAITQSAYFLIRSHTNNSEVALIIIPLLFCCIVSIFCLRFSNAQRGNIHHDGLMITTAIQSCVKLIIFLGLSIFCLYGIFSSPADMENWLITHPETLQALDTSLDNSNARTLILIFFATALTFPHMYHLAINENRHKQALRTASKIFPLYLLLISIAVLPILWAVQSTQQPYPAFLMALAIGEISQHPSLTLLAYICCLAAACSTTMIMIISLASMCLNHMVLPYYSPHTKSNLYRWLHHTKIVVMLALVVLAYILYLLLNHYNAFTLFSFAAYTAAFQFLPGLLACFYWPKANRSGLISGIITGFLSWGVFIILPILTPTALGLSPILEHLFNLNGDSYWIVATIACLGLNMLAFGVVSLSSTTDNEQRNAAELCSQDQLGQPTLQHLNTYTIEAFIVNLAKSLGVETAQREVYNALAILNMKDDETRPFALRLLRRQIESNLSELFGSTVARQTVSRCIPYQTASTLSNKKDIQLIEHNLENFPANFSGLAAELNSLRRYHRNTLEQLPIGVCTFSNDNEVLMWNYAMFNLTGIEQSNALGTSINHLASPWSDILIQFFKSEDTQWHNHEQIVNGKTHWLTLHKALTSESPYQGQHHTILLEDVTTLVSLENDLVHNERLASIGRLAAGVAHEIGNPVTGIACLAQNLKYDSDTPEIITAAKDILAQTERITRIVQSLINFSHAGAYNKKTHYEDVNLFLCAEDAIHLLLLDSKNSHNTLINHINPELNARGDTQKLLQVFLNLLKNAMDACENNGEIILSSQLQESIIKITISDNGSGINQELQKQIFEPFFTTKNPGDGTGLGLSVTYSIIEEHNGYIEVESPTNLHLNNGTRFHIYLPQPVDNIKNE